MGTELLDKDPLVIAHDRTSLAAEPKTPPMRSGPTGDAYVDHGATCDRARSGSCFLDGGQRDRAILAISLALVRDESHYSTAVERVLGAEMAKTDEDRPWLADILIDVASTFLIGRFATALKFLRGAAQAQIDEVAVAANLTGIETGFASRASAALAKVSDKHMESAIKAAASPLKKDALAAIKPGKHRSASQQYVRELADGASKSYGAIGVALRANADDAELVVAMKSLESLTTPGEYEAAITEKLQRFSHSGVKDIGRQETTRFTPVDGFGKGSTPSFSQATLRDTRVVWVQFPEGDRQLRYQFHDGHRVDPYLHPGGAHFPREEPATFGPARPITEEAQMGEAVQEEFVSAAVARHKQVWGVDPITVEGGRRWGLLMINAGTNRPHTDGSSSVVAK